MKYEVRITYRSSNTYLEDAPSQEEAEAKAKERYYKGDDGESTGAETSDIVDVYTQEIK